MHKLNSYLIYVLFFAAFLPFAVPMSAAQNAPAEPVESVTKETLHEPKGAGGPVLIELFSSQACFFCPQADRLFADLLKQKHIIGLACHIDYFDVDENSLAQSFCTERQKFYVEALKAGVPYTPQMIVNGAHDVIGYKIDYINSALSDVKAVPEIEIEKSGEGAYTASFFAAEGGGENTDLWLAVYDKPHDITIAEGRNRGKKVTYYNIVSRLEKAGHWDGTPEKREITPTLTEKNTGFVLMAQDSDTGQLMAVGHYAP